MNDIFAAMVHDVFVTVHDSRIYSSVLGVAVTLPNTVSAAGRAKAREMVCDQLQKFSDSLLQDNKSLPFVELIPEGVAAAREACAGCGALQDALQDGRVRVITIDSGEPHAMLHQEFYLCNCNAV